MSVKNALRASMGGLSQMLYEHVLSLKRQNLVSKIEKVKEETTELTEQQQSDLETAWLNIKDSVKACSIA